MVYDIVTSTVRTYSIELRFFYSSIRLFFIFFFFFFNDTATTEIYTLSLHDALPISVVGRRGGVAEVTQGEDSCDGERSEEHTSELQSQSNLVCRLLLEKKKKKKINKIHNQHKHNH